MSTENSLTSHQKNKRVEGERDADWVQTPYREPLGSLTHYIQALPLWWKSFNTLAQSLEREFVDSRHTQVLIYYAVNNRGSINA